MNPLITTMIPTAFNAGMQMFQNNINYQHYLQAQERANQFAREERIAAQNYNSLENQYAQMQRVGMNPNLIQGQDFLSSQPVANQSVNPPQGIAPQMPVDSLSQADLAKSQSKNIDAQTITEDLLRDMRYKLGESEIVLNWSNTDMAKQSSLKLAQERSNLGRSFHNLLLEANEIVSRTKVNQATVGSISAQTEGQQISNRFAPMLSRANFNKIVSEAAVNYENVNLMRANERQIQEFTKGLQLENSFKHFTFGDRLHLYRLGVDKEKVGVDIMRTQSGTLTFQFGQMKKYDDWKQSLGIANDAIQVIKGFQDINPLSRFMNLNSSSDNLHSVAPLLGSPFGGTFGAP